MVNRKLLTNEKGEVHKLTQEDFALAVPFSKLPKEMQTGLFAVKRRGRPRVERPKRLQSFKLSPELIEAIRASGKGYNSRVECALRIAVEEGRI